MAEGGRNDLSGGGGVALEGKRKGRGEAKGICTFLNYLHLRSKEREKSAQKRSQKTQESQKPESKLSAEGKKINAEFKTLAKASQNTHIINHTL